MLKNRRIYLVQALATVFLVWLLAILPAQAESIWGGIDPHKEFLFLTIIGVSILVEWPIIARIGRFGWQKSLIAAMILNLVSVIVAYLLFKDPMKFILGSWKYDGIHSVPMFPVFCTLCVLLNAAVELPLLVVVFGWRFKPLGLAGILLANFISVYAAAGMTIFVDSTVAPEVTTEKGDTSGNKIAGTTQWNPVTVNLDGRAMIDTKYDTENTWLIKVTLTPRQEKFSEETLSLVNANLAKKEQGQSDKRPILTIEFRPQRTEAIELTGLSPVIVDGSVAMYTCQAKVSHPEDWLEEASRVQLVLSK